MEWIALRERDKYESQRRYMESQKVSEVSPMSVKLLKGLSFAVAAMLYAASCTTIPAKGTSDDCLVVIKTVIVNPDNLALGRDYLLNYSGDQSPSRLGDNNGEFVFVRVRSENVETSTISTGARPGMTGPSQQYEFIHRLPYQPGSIVIADFVFEWSTWRTFEGHFMSSVKVRKISDEEKANLMSQLKQDSRFASWFQTEQ